MAASGQKSFEFLRHLFYLNFFMIILHEAIFSNKMVNFPIEKKNNITVWSVDFLWLKRGTGTHYSSSIKVLYETSINFREYSIKEGSQKQKFSNDGVRVRCDAFPLFFKVIDLYSWNNWFLFLMIKSVSSKLKNKFSKNDSTVPSNAHFGIFVINSFSTSKFSSFYE